MRASRIVVLGAGGQLGRALQQLWAGRDDVSFFTRSQVDVSDAAALDAVDWTECTWVVNAAAYTSVDAAETGEGRVAAWQLNAVAPARLAALASRRRLALVHISSDYVFDGTELEHTEDEPFSPLGVYGQSKAAGDIAVATTPLHRVLRTSWVVGEGNNFVRTMASLAASGVDPSVVGDQVGRLTFADELARATGHIVDTDVAPGTYNVTNSGSPRSWADIARRVFELAGHDPSRVAAVSTDEYYAGKPGIAPRPRQSALDLARIRRTGFAPEDHERALERYVAGLGGKSQAAH